MDFNLDDFLSDFGDEDFNSIEVEEESSVAEIVERIDLSKNNPSLILDAIDTFSSVEDNKSHLSIYVKALKPIAKLKGIVWASLFQVTEDYDIVLRSVEPYEEHEMANKVFEDFSNIGRVGKTLQSGLFHEVTPRDEIEHIGSIFPLIFNNKIWGMLIVEYEKDIETNNYNEAFDLYSRILGPNLKLKEEQDSLDALSKEQNQIISRKTLELQNSRREINTIIDTVQAGIILADKVSKKIISINPFAESFTGYRHTELDKSELNLKDLFPNYNISYGPVRDTVNTKGGRHVDVLRNSNIVKLSDRDTIVETFLDISFIADIKKEHEVEKSILIKQHDKELGEQKENLLKQKRSHNTNDHISDEQLDLSDNKRIQSHLSKLHHQLRQPLSELSLLVEIMYQKSIEPKDVEYIKKLKDRSSLSISNIQTILENSFHTHDLKKTDILSPKYLFNQIINKESNLLEIKVEIKEFPDEDIVFNHFVYIRTLSNILRHLDTLGVKNATATAKIYGAFIKLE